MLFMKRTFAVLVATIPVDIIIAGAIIKGVGLQDAGLIIMGMIVLLVGGLYAWFGAKEENRLPLGIMVIGLVVTITSMLALTIGLALTTTPVAFLGAKKLWTKKD